jgi:hypothetical protein
MSLSSLPSAARVNVGGLLVAAVGIVIQIAAGVDYPTIPPGLIILLVTGGLVTFGRWAWTSLIGVLVPLFLFVGGIAAPTGRDNLAHPGDFGQFAGTLIQLVAVAVALAAGLLVLRDWRNSRAVRT